MSNDQLIAAMRLLKNEILYTDLFKCPPHSGDEACNVENCKYYTSEKYKHTGCIPCQIYDICKEALKRLEE